MILEKMKIESLSYDEAKKIAIEEMKIKGHDCLIAELEGGFGYSALVFKNGRHIYYANEYELHHEYMAREQGKEALRQYYINELNKKLFTDEEMLASIDSYDEYNRKDNFLRNYWIMRFDYVSPFAISMEEKEAIKIEKETHPYFCSVCWSYVADESIVEEAHKYSQHLKTQYKKLQEDIDKFRNMDSYELSNHEACITGSVTDALDALGLESETLSDTQQKIVTEELKNRLIDTVFRRKKYGLSGKDVA